MERVCLNCGAVLGADVRYCMRCGTPYTSARPDFQSLEESGVAPKLVDNYGQVHSLIGRVNSIGSDSENAIVVDDPGIAPFQAEIRLQESGWVLVNLGEPADMSLNEQSISEKQVLSDEDVINLGATRLRFVATQVPRSTSQNPVIPEASRPEMPPMGMQHFRSGTDWLPQSGGSSASALPVQKNCKACGRLILAEAEICPECGVRQVAATPVVTQKSRKSAALLAILLGSFGAHKFYLGNTLLGVLYLIFFWSYIPGVLGIVEGIYYLTLSDEQFIDKYC